MISSELEMKEGDELNKVMVKREKSRIEEIELLKKVKI